MEDIIIPNACIKQPNGGGGGGVEKKANNNNNRPAHQKDQILNCPRCNSTNTKFCYYNNYSLSQPRYFCKTCRRYWTEGGSLRNIPVGGGSRKNNKRSSSSLNSATPPFKKLHDLPSSSSSQNPNQNPLLEGQDLNLAFPSATTTTAQHHLSALQLLSGVTPRGYSSSSFLHLPISDPNYSSSGFPMQDFKPNLNFALHGLAINGYPNPVNHQDQSAAGGSSRRPLFPFEDLRRVSNNAASNQAEQNREEQGAAGYWNGMLGGGSSW